MREFKIILPSFGHDHNAKLLQFEENLISAFGGFTRTTGYGAWDNGSNHETRIERELVHIYTVAANEPVDRVKITRIARRVASDFDQTAVYVRHCDGEVEFISP